MTETRRGPRVRRGTAPALLLEAARELFAERGYHLSTTRQIADRAGVSEDLIFRYYGTKSGLLTEAVLRPLTERIDELGRLWNNSETLQDRPDGELIRWFVSSLYDLMENNRTTARAVSQILTEGPNDAEFDELRVKFSGLFEPLESALDNQLRVRGLRRTDPALQLRMIMIQAASMAVFLPSTYREGAVPERGAIIEEISTAVLNGLRS